MFICYLIDVDESTDMTDTAQLAVFIRGVDDNFNIYEEMAGIYTMKGTKKGCDIFESLLVVLNRFNLKFANMSGVITDGAPGMVSKHEGLVALIKKGCITRHNALPLYNTTARFISKFLNFEEVMKIVIKVVNFIKSRGLNHREFQNFLSETYSQHEDVVYYSDVRWLSRGKMLESFFDLKETIQSFMESKGKPVS